MPSAFAGPLLARPLSALQVRWLAETVRRQEEAHGTLEDSAALAAALAAPAEFEARVLARAEVLGAREGWRDAILRSSMHVRLLLALAALLALAIGYAAAAGVLGDASRPVNVVWALGGLLGVHLLSLLLWVMGLMLAGAGLGAAAGGGLPGRVGASVLAALDRSPAAAALPTALAGLLAPGRSLRWGLGAINHGLWALALIGASAGALLLFATRRYDFVWETTILPADAFVGVGAALGHLPAALGFPVPDAATVAASGMAGAALDEAGRRAWAGWLLGCLLVYGLIPRLLLAALCALLWRRACAGLRLDLAQPGYAVLQARLLPDSVRLGVSDPAPPLSPRSCGQRGQGGGSGGVALALELGTDLFWPPAFLPAPGDDTDGRLDSREQRGAWLARLRAQTPRRLLIAVDARQTPDRGSLGLIAELAALAGETRVWALRPAGAADRLAQWQAGLDPYGIDLLGDERAARAWLETA